MGMATFQVERLTSEKEENWGVKCVSGAQGVPFGPTCKMLKSEKWNEFTTDRVE